jgi:hypothetical protein
LSVDTGEVLVITKAGLESSVLGSVGGVVRAADTIKDVLAEVGGIGTSGVADLEAESIATHEVVPFNNLLVGVVGAIAESVREDETTKRISSQVSTVGIEFTTKIVRLDVDQGLIDETNNLDVIRSPHELHTLEGTSGDNTSSEFGVGAPCDFLSLSVSNQRVWLWGSPETEVVKRVEERRLAERFGARGGRVTLVVTELSSTKKVVGISLVRNAIGVVKVLGSKRNSGELALGGVLGGDRNGEEGKESRKSDWRHSKCLC